MWAETVSCLIGFIDNPGFMSMNQTPGLTFEFHKFRGSN
jgi:hypothetical protein